MLDLFKDTSDCPSPSSSVVPSLEKLCQAVVIRNDKANLQTTLNKGQVVHVSHFCDRL